MKAIRVTEYGGPSVLKLQETPLYSRARELGKTSQSPTRESLGNTRNWKLILLALFGMKEDKNECGNQGVQCYKVPWLTDGLPARGVRTDAESAPR